MAGLDPPDDDEFLRLIDGYWLPPADLNPDLHGAVIDWIENDPEIGVAHFQKHGVTKQEVEEVLMETPPSVEAKRSPHHPDRTLFWGATRFDRWLFIVCLDRVFDGRRVLTPITAFEPSEGEAYWRKQ